MNPAIRSPLLASLFEPGVAAAELRTPGDPQLLFPSEAQAATAFAPKRRAEFSAGRACARRALRELGSAEVAIDVNADRTPCWPAAIVGSITHTTGFCGAVVAHARAFAGIGVDAEFVGRVTPDLYARIMTDDELAALAACEESLRARFATLVFSAKEAFYKCEYGLARAWRDFHDVSLELSVPEAMSGEFSIRAHAKSHIDDWAITLPVRGRFAIANEVVLTGIAVQAVDGGLR